MEESEKCRMTGALEAVLFAMGEPVECTTLAKALDTDLVTILEVIEELKNIYEDAGRGITLLEIDGKVQLCTKACYYDNLIRIASMPEKPTLSNTLMETLAIVAYKQPVTKAEISKIRGVASDHAVNRLVEFGLIQEAGRLNAPGRPILFATTEEFLRRFGMNSLENLPVPEKEEDPAELESIQEEIPEGALIMGEEDLENPALQEIEGDSEGFVLEKEGSEGATIEEMAEEGDSEDSVLEEGCSEGSTIEEMAEEGDSEGFVLEERAEEGDPEGSNLGKIVEEEKAEETQIPAKTPLNLDQLAELEDFDDLDTEDLLNALSLMEESQGEDYMDLLSDSSDEDDDYM